MKDNTYKKLNISLIVIVILSISLVFTSVVLAMAIAEVPNNVFKTGIVDIEIGSFDENGEVFYYEEDTPMIDGEEKFEPGYTLVRDFFVENKDGNEDVYGKVYFTNIEGLLKDELLVNLTDMEEDKLLFEGKASEFTSSEAFTIKKEDKHRLRLFIHYPEECGNQGKGTTLLTFDICAKAVQSRNNDDKEFDD